VTVPAQRRAHGRPVRLIGLFQEPAQVTGLLARRRLDDHLGRRRAYAAKRLQRAAAKTLVQLAAW